MLTLRQDGWQKVLEGITTPMEVMNVTSREEKRRSGKTPNERATTPPVCRKLFAE